MLPFQFRGFVGAGHSAMQTNKRSYVTGIARIVNARGGMPVPYSCATNQAGLRFSRKLLIPSSASSDDHISATRSTV